MIISIGLAGWLPSVWAQESPLPVKNETPAPSPIDTRPQLNIPEIPSSIEPPKLVPDVSATVPIPRTVPAVDKRTLPLSQLDSAFQSSPLAQAAEEQRLHVEWRKLQNQTAQDPDVVAAKSATKRAKTDLEKRDLLRAYYNIYYAHMKALAPTAELRNYLDRQKAAAINALGQPRVRPGSGSR